MKILLLNAFDTGGGAAQAAVRLVEALNQHNVNATLGVIDKKSLCPYVFEVPKKKQNKALYYIRCFFNLVFQSLSIIFDSPLTFLHLKFNTTNNILHSKNNSSIIDINWINKSDFDVVNLHWICGNMISIKDISRITKPIVWTLHDSWPCCGAEHHQNLLENDKRYQTGYFRNNKPKTTIGPDICRKVWNKKRKYLMNKNITFIAPSKWEQDTLKSSYLFKDKECFCIPNIIDHEIFYQKNSNQIRAMYNIPLNKKILGFGAACDINDPKAVKGSYYLFEMLKKLKNPELYYLVIFGPTNSVFAQNINIPFLSTGYIENTTILSTIYNACDIFICPSIVENLPYTCLESICCGVPVVAFDVGGNSDIIEHKVNGYLAKPYDTQELANGVNYCLDNRKELSENCLLKAKKDFDTEKTIDKYIQTYESVMRK